MITRNSDNLALYGDGWTLTEDGAYSPDNGTRDRKVNLSNATLHNVRQPRLWAGGFYTYDGEFHLTAIGLAAAKVDKKTALDAVFDKIGKRPIVDTGLGFNAQGGYQDVVNLEKGIKQSSVKFRDDLNVTHVVTTDQLSDILELIESNGSLLMNNKWDLADAIAAAENKTELDAININEGWA